MINPFPQIRLVHKKSGHTPAYMTAFIGGFADVYSGICCRFQRRFNGFFEEVPFLKAYYHWDGCSLGILRDNCHSIAYDIADIQQALPDVPVVLIGHSYGGSAAMEVARKLHGINQCDSKLIVLTIDAVSRRQPKTRAEGLLFWGNSHIYEGGGFIDVVPRVGGRWGACPDADVDLACSGYAESSPGIKFSHRLPEPMVFKSPQGTEEGSLADYARQVLRKEIGI